MKSVPVLLTAVGVLAIIASTSGLAASTSGLAAALAAVCIAALGTIVAMFAFGTAAGWASRPRGASQWEIAIRTRREEDPTPGWSGYPLDAAPQRHALDYDAEPAIDQAPPAYGYVWVGDLAIAAPQHEGAQRVMRAAPRTQVIPRHARGAATRRPSRGPQ